MRQQSTIAVKRLALSLLAATALGGCAVYEPGYPGYGYDPYYYGAPAYSGVPYYVGPPISLGLWFDARSGGGRGGHHGGHGRGWGGRGR